MITIGEKIIVLAGVGLSAAAIALYTPTVNVPIDPANSVVKIEYPDGHGSATHLGNGYYITAAHVVDTDAEFPLKFPDGSTGGAILLWSNSDYDIALIYSDDASQQSSPIDCNEGKTGDGARLVGNPQSITFITTRGYIAGPSRQVGPWADVLPVNAAVAPGMSGGGMFNDDGSVSGVIVGRMLVPSRFSSSGVSISYVVPSSAVCHLMGLNLRAD